jgi:hypothetical protein
VGPEHRQGFRVTATAGAVGRVASLLRADGDLPANRRRPTAADGSALFERLLAVDDAEPRAALLPA